MDTTLPSIMFPPSLKTKGTIGLVSPGRWPEPAWIDKTRVFLAEHHYQLEVHAQNYLKEGRLAGSDAARAEAVMDMFADSTIDAILCSRGGTGAMQLLDRLDYDLIRENPKPFVGFSDMTVLLHALSQRSGFVTYHGPMAVNFGKPDVDPRTGVDFMSVVGNRRKHSRLHYPDVECLHQGKTEGILLGGNIKLLQHLIGTPFDWSGQGAILFLEDVDEHLYKIDRALCHLRLAGKFQGLKGVLIGEMTKIPDYDEPADSIPYGRELRDIFLDHLPADIPIGFNFPCGHGRYITTLPVGARVQLTLGPRGAEISYTTTPPE